MMRSGRILVEDSPERLMSARNMTNLDDVFLKLCIEDDLESNNKTKVN